MGCAGAGVGVGAGAGQPVGGHGALWARKKGPTAVNGLNTKLLDKGSLPEPGKEQHLTATQSGTHPGTGREKHCSKKKVTRKQRRDGTDTHCKVF